MGIPSVAIIDTNCDPDEVTYAIPGNYDAIRSINLITHLMAEAIIEGKAIVEKNDDAQEGSGPEEAAAVVNNEGEDSAEEQQQDAN